MNVMRVTVDPTAGNLARAVTATAKSGRLVILTARMFTELAAELGSDEAAMHHLRSVATAASQPIGCNFPTPDGSRTAFVSPRGWSDERLAGFVAARHEDLEAMFGPAIPSRLEAI